MSAGVIAGIDGKNFLCLSLALGSWRKARVRLAGHDRYPSTLEYAGPWWPEVGKESEMVLCGADGGEESERRRRGEEESEARGRPCVKCEVWSGKL